MSKSEPRLVTLARGLVAVRELRKGNVDADLARIRAEQAGAKAIGVKKLYSGRHGTSQGVDPRRWDPAAHQEAADAYRHAADMSERVGTDPNHIAYAKMRAAEHDIKAKIAGHLQSGDHASARAAINELVALPHGNPDTKARLTALAGKLSKTLDEHAQQASETFTDYAHRHAKRWAKEREGLAEPEAEAYARHFAQTYPEGLDEDGRSIDHPVAYRNWQEQTTPRPSPASTPTPTPSKPKAPRKKPAPVPSGRIAWMHGQRPK